MEGVQYFQVDTLPTHRVWNGLPEHVVTAASLTLFKKYLRIVDFSSCFK